MRIVEKSWFLIFSENIILMMFFEFLIDFSISTWIFDGFWDNLQNFETTIKILKFSDFRIFHIFEIFWKFQIFIFFLRNVRNPLWTGNSRFIGGVTEKINPQQRTPPLVGCIFAADIMVRCPPTRAKQTWTILDLSHWAVFQTENFSKKSYNSLHNEGAGRAGSNHNADSKAFPF